MNTLGLYLNYLSPSTDYFRCHPAFLYGLASLLGASIALFPISPPLLLIMALFSILTIAHVRITKESLRRPLLAICLGASAYMLTSERSEFSGILPPAHGTALVELNAVSFAKTPFGKKWNYRAVVRTFTYKGETIARNLPVKLSMPYDPSGERPKAGFSYRIEAALKRSDRGAYFLTPAKDTAWRAVERSWSLAEWRYSAKSAFQESVHKSFGNQHTAAFLSGMVTGVFDDRVLAFELGRFGLQHLMAISGLHFTILSAIIGAFCGLFFSRKIAALAVISTMTAYFIFLGDSPSVIRAWISLLIGLSALFLEKRGAGINALGIGLIAIVFWDPAMIREIGFQFSFGITAAILLWYSPCDRLFQSLFPKRALNETAPMDRWDQHGYCLLYFLRQGLALSLAVNLAAMPLTLYYFHKFPLMSLVYNLFFPVMVGPSLFLLAIASCIGWAAPWLASLVHSINEAYTGFLLNFAFNLPRGADLSWQVSSLPPDLLVLYLFFLLLGGISLQKRDDQPAFAAL